MAATGVFAQDQKSERREKLRQLGEAAAGIAVERIENASERREAEVVTGNVIMLQGKSGGEAKDVNNGGLVIVRVQDSGSRPPQDINVNVDDRFQRLGQVRGVAEKGGKALMGGGYTWILLKPVLDGEGIVAVSFKANDGGEVVKKEFKVNVTAAAAE
ncbi:MAG: hypothetical protein H0T51_13050 [Pirellulales bacterium]|nr:hypothetical protein [Pirellulales bacterium]